MERIRQRKLSDKIEETDLRQENQINSSAAEVTHSIKTVEEMGTE